MIRTTPSAGLAIALAISTPLAASDLNSGANIYRMHCAQCHGVNGRSVMAGAPDFDRPDSLLKPDDSLLSRIQSGKNACPAYRGILSEQKIFDVIAFIRTLGI
ncbi:MAG: c-type cytochrome [Gammaproteobacteria bacterium]|nr:c-type cytochrome [Gammaproteobacteria bacterium]